MSQALQAAIDPAVAAWCQEHLGGEPVERLFRSVHLSRVEGFRLADGRDVVVKARPAAARIHACVEVQRRLHAAGFPCPEPLAGPAPLGALVATAETYVPGGVVQESRPGVAARYAAVLAKLVALAPSVDSLPAGLDPAPSWARWDHDHAGVWPLPDDRDTDLNDHAGPVWLDDLGERVRDRLGRFRGDDAVGHVDWEAQNLRWVSGCIHAVHDWDSLAARPEAVIAGLASVAYTATGVPLTEATVDDSEAFLAAYESSRGRTWTRDEREACWAAGLWARAFNARKVAHTLGSGLVLDRLRLEVPARCNRAGIQ